jgi:ATP-dependent Clp protease ATP-binding subunit ClpX
VSLEKPSSLSEVRCSSCEKPGDQVASTARGPRPDVAICNECVELCNEMIVEQTTRPADVV